MRYSAYNLEVIHEAIRIAKQEGLLVSLDLASFEVQAALALYACKSFFVFFYSIFQ